MKRQEGYIMKNKNTGKTINVTVYDLKGTQVFKGETSFDSRGQLLRYVTRRNVPGVAAIMLNNQPVVFDKRVVDNGAVKIDHEYYLDKNLQTFDKKTHAPTIVPVDVIGRLISKEK